MLDGGLEIGDKRAPQRRPQRRPKMLRHEPRPGLVTAPLVLKLLLQNPLHGALGPNSRGYSALTALHRR
jgi:hypothetical protein